MANNDPLAELFPNRSGPSTSPASAVRLPESDQCCRSEASVFRRESEAPGKGRRKLWHLPHRFHCAVIGTCLEVDELRGLAPEVGLGDLSELSDYDVHTRFVGMAGEKSPLSQRLQGLLDRRYRGALRRFRRLRDEDGLREQWRADVAEGRIAGAFWALVSHPATTSGLAYEVYGEIHMLGHQVGAGIRSGLRRLSELESRNQELTAQLRQAEARANEHLSAKQRALEERDRWRERAREAEARAERAETSLKEWQEGERTRALQRRIEQLEREVRHHDRRAQRAEQAPAAVAAEGVPEPRADTPSAAESPAPAARGGGVPEGCGDQPCRPDLSGRCILCVGGRRGLSDRYRQVVEAAGGEFLHHDGGIEHGDQRLNQLLERADHVVCPVDCVSHQATRCVKDHCKRSGLPCLFLESASVTALSRALPRLQGQPARPQ
jgi:hypothetical protein